MGSVHGDLRIAGLANARFIITKANGTIDRWEIVVREPQAAFRVQMAAMLVLRRLLA